MSTNHDNLRSVLSNDESVASLSSSDENVSSYIGRSESNSKKPPSDEKIQKKSVTEVQPLEETSGSLNDNNNNNNNNNRLSNSQRRLSEISQYSRKKQIPINDNALESISRSISRAVSELSDDLERTSHVDSTEGLSVRDLYPDMNEEQIKIARTQTRNTILNTLSERVAKTVSRNTEILNRRREIEDEDSEEAQKEIERESALLDEEDKNSIYPDIPENNHPIKDYGDEFTSIDPELVTWDGPEDPQFPRNWPNSTKYLMTAIIALNTIISPMSSSMLSPGMKYIVKDFGVTNSVVEALIISIFILAWAIFPLVVAPCSEMFGRKIVLMISIWFLLIFNLACGLAQTTAQMCVFRFLAGCGGAAPMSIGPGVLGDLFDNKERSTAMAFYSIGPTFGPVFAPIMAGFIVEKKSWRWIFWVLVIINGACALTTTCFLKESYAPVLLGRKAEKLRKSTGNSNLKTIFDMADTESMSEKLAINIKRPLKLLLTNPMVFGLGIFMAFVYGFMYLLISSFPSLWGEVYGFNSGISGLLYIPMGIGFGIGIILWTHFVNKTYNDRTEANNGIGKPEFRLPCLIWAGFGCPIGLIWYGWTAEKHLHWILPSIGSAIFAFFIIVVFQTIQNYLIDMNPRFAASSSAAAATFRSIFGFSFPLFSTPLYNALGYGWGNTMFAFIGFALGIPFPVFLLKYGERLRLWANARLELEQAKRDAKNLSRLKERQKN